MANFRQLDPGTYNLHCGSTHVGAVFVEAGPALDTTIEHYVLFPPYVAPSFQSGVGSVNDLIIRAVPWQQLTPNATSVVTGTFNGLNHFLAILADFAEEVDGAFKYVRADCYTQDGIPTP